VSSLIRYYMPQIALVVTLYWHATTIIKWAEMTLAESFLLGMMVAWTPSLIFLGWCLLARNVPDGGSVCQQMNERRGKARPAPPHHG
jgi:hypothetical protein